MAVVTHIRLETHAEIFIFDPFPTTVAKRFDDCSRDAILASIKREFVDDLIATAIFDISVVQIDGIVYKSDPINVSIWNKED